MTPTLDEMKLAVAKMLPGHIGIGFGPPKWASRGYETTKADVTPVDVPYWNDTGRSITDREWREVCALAVEELTGDDRSLYCDTLASMADYSECGPREAAWIAEWYQQTAPIESRLLALCRVKCPEIFLNPNPTP